MSKKQYVTWHEANKLYAYNVAPMYLTKSELILELTKNQKKIKFDLNGKKLPKIKYLGYDGVGFFLQER